LNANLFRAAFAAAILAAVFSDDTRAQSAAAESGVSTGNAETGAAAAETPPAFKTGRLEQLLAPVALYPDALLAQILMAATYPLEVVKARRWLQNTDHAALQGAQLASALAAEEWDPSVKSLVSFPRILGMMDDQLDWTEQLGSAFAAHQADVMDSIQRLRHEAAAAGTLWSDPQHRVTTEGQGIVIEPANPEVIFPPIYNPAVVYGPWPYPDYPPLDIVPPDYGLGFALPLGIGFGAGIGVVQPLWRWCAFDWGGRRIWLDAGRPNSHASGQRAAGSSIWRHDPINRLGMPGQGFSWRSPGASAPALVDRPAAFSPKASLAVQAFAPAMVLRAARSPLVPAGARMAPRLSQGGFAARPIVAPLHFAPSMSPRAVVRSSVSEGGGRSGGLSHR
jgi:hypothetical protein